MELKKEKNNRNDNGYGDGDDKGKGKAKAKATDGVFVGPLWNTNHIKTTTIKSNCNS